MPAHASDTKRAPLADFYPDKTLGREKASGAKLIGQPLHPRGSFQLHNADPRHYCLSRGAAMFIRDFPEFSSFVHPRQILIVAWMELGRVDKKDSQIA